MEREEVLKLAHECDCLDDQHYGSVWAEKLERFAAAIGAMQYAKGAEVMRERAHDVADEYSMRSLIGDDGVRSSEAIAEALSAPPPSPRKENKMCECYQIGGPFIAEDPDCPLHGNNGLEAALATANERIKAVQQENIQLKLDKLKAQAATTKEREVSDKLVAALEKIADLQGSWGPFPESKKEWAGMAVVVSRETLSEVAAIRAKQAVSCAETG